MWNTKGLNQGLCKSVGKYFKLLTVRCRMVIWCGLFTTAFVAGLINNVKTRTKQEGLVKKKLFWQLLKGKEDFIQGHCDR